MGRGDLPRPIGIPGDWKDPGVQTEVMRIHAAGKPAMIAARDHDDGRRLLPRSTRPPRRDRECRPELPPGPPHLVGWRLRESRTCRARTGTGDPLAMPTAPSGHPTSSSHACAPPARGLRRRVSGRSRPTQLRSRSPTGGARSSWRTTCSSTATGIASAVPSTEGPAGLSDLRSQRPASRTTRFTWCASVPLERISRGPPVPPATRGSPPSPTA
jgi:hypothetical protein